MNHFLKNKFGFGLAQVMVAAGLMGGLALVATKMMNMQTKQAKTISSKGDFSSLVDDIHLILKDPELCTKTMRGRTFTSGTDVGTPPSPFPDFDNGKFNQITIDSLKFKDVTQVNCLGAPCDPPRAHGAIELKASFKNTYGGQSQSKKIYFLANLNPGGTIKDCSGTGEAKPKALCETIGGNWSGGTCVTMSSEQACEHLGGTWNGTACVLPTTAAAPPPPASPPSASPPPPASTPPPSSTPNPCPREVTYQFTILSGIGFGASCSTSANNKNAACNFKCTGNPYLCGSGTKVSGSCENRSGVTGYRIRCTCSP